MSDPSKLRKHLNLGAIFDKHVKSEFEEHDVEATMKTMVKEPYVHHVPILTGETGYNEVSWYTTNIQVCRTTTCSGDEIWWQEDSP